MKTDLDHLSSDKQRELARIVDVLHEELAKKIENATQPHRRNGRILKIILYGSYARGTQVEDPKGAYFSDYDILIVVSHSDFTDFAAWWNAAEDRIYRDKSVQTVPQFIVHTMDEVNTALSEGRYFFIDILRDGVMLYEFREAKASGSAKYRFATPKPPGAKLAHEMASEYFGDRLPHAKYHCELARKAMSDGQLKHAAFELHQAAEQTYGTFLLTKTLYLPKDHNVRRLRSRAEDIEPRLRDAWPRGQKPYDRRFELLRRAYVEARYSKHYEITPEELAWLADRIEVLIGIVETVCKEHLSELEKKTLV